MINETTRTHYQFNIINIDVTVLGLLIFPFSYFEDIIPPFFLKKKEYVYFHTGTCLMTFSLYSFCAANYSHLCLQSVDP